MNVKEILERLHGAFIDMDKLTKEELRSLLRDAANVIAEQEADSISDGCGNRVGGN